jgi:hypothetical protein
MFTDVVFGLFLLLAYRLSLSNTDDDFSKMRAALLVAVCRRGVGKWKYAINRRLELVPGNGTVHRFKHVAAADINAANERQFSQDFSERHFAHKPAHAADDAYRPA